MYLDTKMTDPDNDKNITGLKIITPIHKNIYQYTG